jgi:hypothetical protein
MGAKAKRHPERSAAQKLSVQWYTKRYIEIPQNMNDSKNTMLYAKIGLPVVRYGSAKRGTTAIICSDRTRVFCTG